MSYELTDFKHYQLDPGDVEKLIEMWQHFHPKDNPYPLNENEVYLNDKNKKVNNFALLFNLTYPVLKTVQKVQTFYTVCIHLRTYDIMKHLTDNFIKNFKTKEEKVEKDVINNIPDSKPKKTRKKE